MKIDPLAVEDEAGFAQLFAIYRDAIDPSEQKTEAMLRRMLGQATSLFLIARDASSVQGFVILWLPDDADIWSLEYMAVATAHRGAGLGAELFRASVAAAARPFGLIEVEAPLGPMQQRRLGFYARLGCRRLGAIDYLLPLRIHGEPPPMWLLVHGAVDTVTRAQARDWLTRLYVEVYDQTPDDPRIAQMLAAEGERIALTGLPATPS